VDSRLFKHSPAGRIVRAPTGYDAFVPHALPPPIVWTPQLVATLSEADRSLGELAGIGRTLANPHLLIVPFMRKEAVLSSAIEGTEASISDLYAYEAEQLTFLKRPADVREVHNYVRALERGIQRLQALPVSLRLIRELHRDLMEGVRGDRGTPGEFRRSQNWIGPPGSTLENSNFVPPPVSEMMDCLDQFERYLHVEDDVPPLVRVGLIHYQFEAIHPFIDGNGRLGRLLITLLLRAWGLLPQALLYLSAYFEARRDQYYDLLLKVSQRGDWERWLTFFLNGIALQARDARLRSGRIQDLHAQYRSRYQVEGPARMLQVVDQLFARPMLSIPQLSRALGVKYPVASRYVSRLEQDGLLVEITGKGRNRLYLAQGILEAIEEPVDMEGAAL